MVLGLHSGGWLFRLPLGIGDGEALEHGDVAEPLVCAAEEVTGVARCIRRTTAIGQLLGELPRSESLLRLPEHIVCDVEGCLAYKSISRLLVIEEVLDPGLVDDSERAGHSESATLGFP